LEKIDKESKSLNTELRQVNNLLKFDPDNVELAAQKQEILSKQVEATSDRLRILRSNQEEVMRLWENGDIGDAELREFQRELIATEGKLGNYKEQLSSTEQATDDMGDSAKEAAQDLAKLGTAAAAALGYTVNVADSTDSAMNSLAAQTGFTREEMEKYKAVMEEIYLDNYGEDLNDIANTMAMVKQYTGEVDPTKLQELTESAIAMEDTFSMDMSETLRGVDALMRNMGLTAEEAFDYMSKGAQNGLNKSGELADNIAEYSQLWAQAGFSAEEMFVILQNGLDSGAYNLDKVNDFVKEFSISLADGRIEENIGSFSTESQALFEAWKNGEASSKEVFQSIINDLSEMENQQEALTLASNVWSSLGEDNAMTVITSLNDVNDTYDDVAGNMESIKDIKYDDLANEFQELGRQIKVEMIEPIGEELLPVAKNFINWTSSHLEELIPIVTTLGAVFGTIFVVNKVAKFVSSIKTLNTAFSTLFAAISANPMAAIAIGISAATVAIAAAVNEIDTLEDVYNNARDSAKELDTAEQALVDSITASSEAYSSLMAAREESNQSILAEYANCETLYDELQNLVDENGKVKDGYEARAEAITTILANALGIEIEMIDGVIVEYEALQGSIETLIETKKAEALISANQSAYTEAIANQTAAFVEYNAACEAVKATEEEIIKTREALATAQSNLDYATNAADVKAYEKEIAELEGTLSGLNSQWGTQVAAMNNAGTTYSGYMSVIENYEGLLEAVATGDVAAMNTAVTNLTYNFKTATTATKTELQNQLTNYQDMYEAMKQAVEDGAPGITQAQVDAMAKMVAAAENELKNFPDDVGVVGQTASRSFVAGINSGRNSASEAGKNIGDSTSEGMKRAGEQAEEAGREIGSRAASGVEDSSSGMKRAGEQAGADYSSGVNSNSASAGSAGSNLGSSAKNGASGVSMYETGQNASQGFINGMNSKLSIITNTAASLARTALNAMNKELDVNSPSRKTYETGEYFDEGFANAIDDKTVLAIDAASNMASDTTDALKKAVDGSDFDLYGDTFETPNSMMNKDIYSSKSNQVNTTTNNNETSLNITIKEFVNNRQQDVKDFAQEVLEYASEIKAREERVYA
ncbi:MAG: phage tail tape measure protein, partial [Lachnospiraceae bacterium]|nr:phage tail tape measure protein [Lachnospiraceae bacterium]